MHLLLLPLLHVHLLLLPLLHVHLLLLPLRHVHLLMLRLRHMHLLILPSFPCTCSCCPSVSLSSSSSSNLASGYPPLHQNHHTPTRCQPWGHNCEPVAEWAAAAATAGMSLH